MEAFLQLYPGQLSGSEDAGFHIGPLVCLPGISAAMIDMRDPHVLDVGSTPFKKL